MSDDTARRMIEAVAREICHYASGPSDLNSCCAHPMGKKSCQIKALAAVRALAEAGPSEGMCEVALNINFTDYEYDALGYFRDIFAAMLAQLIAEIEQEGKERR